MDEAILRSMLTERLWRRSDRQSAQRLVGRADAQVRDDAELVGLRDGEPRHAIVMFANRQDMDRGARIVALPPVEERREAEVRADRFKQRMPIIDPANGACHAVEDDAQAALLNMQHEIEQTMIVSEGGPAEHARI